MAPAVLISVILFGLGALALFGVFVSMPQPANPTVTIPDSLMFAEQTAPFVLKQQSPNDTKRLLSAVRDQNITLGSILRIAPTVEENGITRLASPQEVLKSLGVNVSDSFSHSVQGIPFLGIHAVDTNSPVIVFSLASYENAFAGMLAWEKTINTDLSPFFTAVPPTYLKDGVPTVRTFTDEVIKNYDIRALRNDQGKIILYYSFPTRNILVIAESPFSFTEILSRLRAQREI
jgi:hypothetical protein